MLRHQKKSSTTSCVSKCWLCWSCFPPKRPKWVIKQVTQMLKPSWNLYQPGKGGLWSQKRHIQLKGKGPGTADGSAEVNAFFLHFYAPDIDSAMKWSPHWLWFSRQQIHLQVCRQAGLKISIYYIQRSHLLLSDDEQSWWLCQPPPVHTVHHACYCKRRKDSIEM